VATQKDFKIKKGLVVTEDIELGHATDTTIARSSAGVITVEGTTVLLSGAALGTPSGGTLTNCTFPTLNQSTSGSAASLSATLAVASGGTGATSMADKAVIISQDSGTDTLAALALTTSGQLVIGGASGPAAATLTAGSNVTITNADGGITIAASGGGGSVGGSDTEILYNNGGTEDGIASMTWTDTAGSEQLLISDTSDTALVKIVQLGTGSAFEVHDQASDSTYFSIDQSGNTTIGSNASYGNHLQVHGDVGFTTTNFYIGGASGKFMALSGTAASPYYTFNGDTDIGMYRIGADQLGFSTAGTERLTIAADGTVNVVGSFTVGGSAVGGTTGYTWTSTSGSEQFLISDTSDTALLKIQNAGTGSIVEIHDQASDSNYWMVDQYGRQSIKGGIVQGYDLSVAGAVHTSGVFTSGGNASLPQVACNSDLNTGMFYPGTDTLAFTTGGTERLRIGSSGEVTIPGQITSRASVVAVTGTTVLTQAQSGSYVYWTGGDLTLPVDSLVGTHFTIFNDTGSSDTVLFSAGEGVASGWGHDAVADTDATSYVCVATDTWVQVGA